MQTRRNPERVKIIGGGLAGSEAAWQLLKRGYDVVMYEMRPVKTTGAHKTQRLAELVCSNSLKSVLSDTASGALKIELKHLDSLILRSAEAASVPSGGALAVDRERMSEEVEKALSSFPNFTLVREEVTDIDDGEITVVAAGPLVSDALAEKISRLSGEEYLHFSDAVAPIIAADSIDYDKAYFASRYGKGGDDYLNSGMNKSEYLAFYDALINAESVTDKLLNAEFFEGCMPVEVMAKRGTDALRFGPLRPVGLDNPNGQKYYAVAQLRKENLAGDAYNLVGFQTNLLFKEQKRVFGMLPGLENAEFLRYGVMHRNTYVNAPKVLNFDYSMKKHPNIYIAGQLSGVEGYVESAASGLMVGLNVARKIEGKEPIIPDEYTIIGSLTRYITNPAVENLQPMNANFGLLPPIEGVKDKKERKKLYSARCEESIKRFVEQLNER
ncbi:MAG: methylenetetrahydrofolate--tRNA-(uracil(54)-C(5))-methyltransferase (FADH(2)-oxidizing) TrmFO [Clostridia bacterium]|nr:methylenetetrahydrofolate--tRNA-(uracil(54)-C(5))-methyltransferase (FADH(2)-oxidizing) TrmFO [Clostridia bacterium]